MNKHMHHHCETCLETAKGKCGCRMCVPYAHGGSELRKGTTDGSVLANVLFNDGDVYDGNPTLGVCTGFIAVVYLLGAGAPAKKASMHMARCLTKDSAGVSASATVLADAAEHNREHPSTVDDKDVPEHQWAMRSASDEK